MAGQEGCKPKLGGKPVSSLSVASAASREGSQATLLL